MLALLSVNVWGADIILNEYNAVDSNDFLGGGDSSADESGGRASDSYFGRVRGNGGDWFELVVIKDHLDIRGWQLDVYDNKLLDETLTLTSNPIWQDLRAGTIITVSEDRAQRRQLQSRRRRLVDQRAGEQQRRRPLHREIVVPGRRPRTGSCGFATWPDKSSSGLPAKASVPPAGSAGPRSSAWKTIPAIRLRPTRPTTTTPMISARSVRRTAGVSQNFSKLRPVIAPVAATVKVLAPNGGEALAMGDIVDVRWQSSGITGAVRVEFSIDNGYSWTEVYPPNVGNTGTYKWLVPLVNAPKALVRVSSVARPAVYDVSDKTFTIVSSPIAAEMMSFFDISLLA